MYLVSWFIDSYGLVAQRIAHLTSDQKVVGSNPIAVIFLEYIYYILKIVSSSFAGLLRDSSISCLGTMNCYITEELELWSLFFGIFLSLTSNGLIPLVFLGFSSFV